MIGNGCAGAVPDKWDMKIQFEHSNDPRIGGGKERNQTKNLYHFVEHCSDKTDCFADSKPWVQFVVMQEALFSQKHKKESDAERRYNRLFKQILHKIHILRHG